MQLQNMNQEQYTRSRWYRRAFRETNVSDEDRRVTRHVAGASVAAIIVGAIAGAAPGVVAGAIIQTSWLAVALGAVVGAFSGMVLAAMVVGRQAITEEAHREGWD